MNSLARVQRSLLSANTPFCLVDECEILQAVLSLFSFNRYDYPRQKHSLKNLVFCYLKTSEKILLVAEKGKTLH